METTEGTEGTENSAGSAGTDPADRPDDSIDTGATVTGRPVRVGYVAAGIGVALVVDDGDRDDEDGSSTEERGVLRVGDAVVTLEIPRPDGGRSVLSWDPAEVTLDPLVA